MTPESDHDILIELRTIVKDISFNVTQPGGKVPALEAKLEENAKAVAAAAKELARFEGAVRMAKWIIGSLIVLTVGLAGAFLDHLSKGK